MSDGPHEGMWSKAAVAGGCALLLVLVALFAYAPIFAVDFFWHLKLGQLIAETRAIPTTDLFSAVHPERAYVQLQWLWELLVFESYQAGGLRFVRIVQSVAMVISFVVLGTVSLRSFRSAPLSLVFCALALVLFEDRFQTRPSVTALGFVACFLPSWLGQPERRPLRQAALLFALSLIWSNIHAGESLLALLGMGALAIGGSIERRLLGAPTRSEGRHYLLLLAVVLGFSISPTLLRGMQSFGEAIQPQLATGNKEWRPTYTMLENGLAPSFVIIALGPTVVLIAYLAEQVRRVRTLPLQQRRSALPAAEWLLCGGMLVLSQQAVRNAFLCLVPLAFMARRAAPALSAPRTRRLLVAASFCLLLVAFDDHVVRGYGSAGEALELVEHDLSPGAFPEQLTEFMRDARIEGGILNDGRWGGFLIWELWPRNHVFVDTRHDLTDDMWPVFMAAHSPGTRPRAMNDAFARWGVELSAFRGPTFPAVHAEPGWQLLYKAGDQELYQHVSGAHAAQNLARARAWLTARARRPSDELAVLATEVGSERWLRAPYQQLRARKASQLLQSRVPEDVISGLQLQASLLFEAGRYAQARAPLALLVQRAPDDVRVLYQALLCAVALGDRATSRELLLQLSRRAERLSPQQIGRLRAIEGADFLAPSGV